MQDVVLYFLLLQCGLSSVLQVRSVAGVVLGFSKGVCYEHNSFFIHIYRVKFMCGYESYKSSQSFVAYPDEALLCLGLSYYVLVA